jgi:acetylornithine deacetylase/succinyl-diaminopimelate desuccinylase-like protein
MHQLTMQGNDVTGDLLRFAQDLVRIKSYSGQEKQVAGFVARKMGDLGFDEVAIDRYGNVLGRAGDGERIILFDSHTDTVAVTDEAQWQVAPFSGEIRDGALWGRGAADMKSGLAASMYASPLTESTVPRTPRANAGA